MTEADRGSSDRAKAPPRAVTAIRRKLLAWYDRNKRDLPWRKRESDPYAQWVAEIMLQQTRVDTVRRYYDRFLDRFPKVTSLARARESAVMKYWEGLGYYRRARNLHRGAKELAQTGQGVPCDSESLRNLPGVGEYTAAAIASIAGREPIAAVDGNVARVIARLFGIHHDVGSSRGQSRIVALARQLLSRSRPGDFNQAWMDLGSLICTPQTPRCPICPLRKHCKANEHGTADSLPVLKKKKPARPVNLIACAFRRDSKTLMVREESDGWWAGLWRLPTMEIARDNSAAPAVTKLADAHGLDPLSTTRVGQVRHQLTHRTLTFHVYVCDVRREFLVNAVNNLPAMKWATRAGLEKLAISTAHRKLLAAVAEKQNTRNRKRPVATA